MWTGSALAFWVTMPGTQGQTPASEQGIRWAQVPDISGNLSFRPDFIGLGIKQVMTFSVNVIDQIARSDAVAELQGHSHASLHEGSGCLFDDHYSDSHCLDGLPSVCIDDPVVVVTVADTTCDAHLSNHEQSQGLVIFELSASSRALLAKVHQGSTSSTIVL